MSIVTTDQLKDYMSGLGLDADQAGAAQDVLDGLQDDLELYCQRPLERKERTELVIPDELGRLWLRATPIVSISDPEGLYPYSGNAVGGTYALGYNLSFFGGPQLEPVAVTYVGGLEGKDEAAVRLAILRAAAREVSVRHDDTLSVEDLTTKNVQPVDRQDPGFTEKELKRFDRLRRRTAV